MPEEGIEKSFKFHCKDARNILQVIPSDNPLVDVTITSPPYYNLKNYGFDGQIGYGQSFNEYLEDLEAIFGDIYRITKDTGSLWIIVDTFKKRGNLVPLPFDIANRAIASKWRLKDILIWEKDKTLPWSRKGELRSIFEYILFFVKTKKFHYNIDRIKVSDLHQFKEWWVKYPERYNPRGKVPTGIWKFAIPTQGSWGHRFLRHFCPFPTGLVERILLLTTDEGNTVLDPFAGSGVVLAVAHHMRRRYIGFDLKKEYFETFPGVLKEIGQEMEILKQKRQTLRVKQKTLEDTIKRLRLVKYPKTLVRRLYLAKLIEPREFPINTIFAISREFNSDKLEKPDRFRFLKEDLYVVFDSNSPIDKTKFHKCIQAVVSKPPLSKFGIVSDHHLLTRDEFITEQRSSQYFDWQELWLYVRGVMNMYHNSITFDKWHHQSDKRGWKEYFKNNVPPVISNIKVMQSVNRTWKPKTSVVHRDKPKLSLAKFIQP